MVLSRMPASVEYHPLRQVYALDLEAVAKDESLVPAHGDCHSLVSCTPLRFLGCLRMCETPTRNQSRTTYTPHDPSKLSTASCRTSHRDRRPGKAFQAET